MFATKREHDGLFSNIFSRKDKVKMCCSKDEVIYEIQVREALPGEETPYWAWKDSDEHINMIYPDKNQIEASLTYGIKKSTEFGVGKLVKIIVTEK